MLAWYSYLWYLKILHEFWIKCLHFQSWIKYYTTKFFTLSQIVSASTFWHREEARETVSSEILTLDCLWIRNSFWDFVESTRPKIAWILSQFPLCGRFFLQNWHSCLLRVPERHNFFVNNRLFFQICNFLSIVGRWLMNLLKNWIDQQGKQTHSFLIFFSRMYICLTEILSLGVKNVLMWNSWRCFKYN